jgi:hypothetical protein
VLFSSPPCPFAGPPRARSQAKEASLADASPPSGDDKESSDTEDDSSDSASDDETSIHTKVARATGAAAAAEPMYLTAEDDKTLPGFDGSVCQSDALGPAFCLSASDIIAGLH